MIVLDAGILIAFLDRNDVHFDRALEIMSRSDDAPFVVHAMNLAEALVGPARNGRSQEARDDLYRVGVVVADLGDDEALILAEARARHGLKMPDTCALATALHEGVRLETFDQRLTKAWERAAAR